MWWSSRYYDFVRWWCKITWWCHWFISIIMVVVMVFRKFFFFFWNLEQQQQHYVSQVWIVFTKKKKLMMIIVNYFFAHSYHSLYDLFSFPLHSKKHLMNKRNSISTWWCTNHLSIWITFLQFFLFIFSFQKN